MRRDEALSLRAKPLDFDRKAIVIREAKGAKDREEMLPTSVAEPLREQVASPLDALAAMS